MITSAEAGARCGRSGCAAPIAPVTHRERTAVWLAFLGICAGAFAYLMIRGRGNIFVYDEWGWIEFRRSGVSSILNSYNDHLLVAPLAVYQALFRTVGLGDYTVYRVLAVLAHLSCVAATFEFVRRRMGGIAALLIAASLAFFGAGWEYELEGVNFGFTLSLALGIGALLALDSRSRRADVTACALLTVGLVFSEFAALVALGIAAGQIAMDRSHILRRAWVWLAPLVVYGTWWIAYYEPIVSHRDIGAAPKFAMDMVASAAGGLFDAGLQGGRVILLLMVALVAWRVIRRHAFTPTMIALLVTAAVFWGLIALGRGQLNKPWASHYVYTGAILLVLVITESLRSVRINTKLLALGVVLTVVSLAGSVRSIRGGEAYLRTASENVRAELGALRLLGAAVPSNVTLDSIYAPQLVTGPYLAAARALGPAPTDSPNRLASEPESVRLAADDFLLRAGDLATSARATTARGSVGADAPTVEQFTHATITTRGNCVTVRPNGPLATVDVRLAAVGLLIEPRAGTAIRARRFATGFDAAPSAASTSASALIIRSRVDQSSAPWHLQIASPRPIRICTPA